MKSIEAARRKHEFSLWAYVFMPKHVHLLICPQVVDYSIARILQSIKQPVGRRCIRYLKLNNPVGLSKLSTGQNDHPYRFWQDGGGYDRNISRENTLINEVSYIHQNPVRGGLVDSASDWLYSSARLWQGGDGPINIDKNTWPIA